MRSIDLNCDLGEGAGHDAELMPLITSANIACGAHAGDEATMRTTVDLAQRHGVAIGAHPGFADRENFGRVEQPLTGAEAVKLVLEQIGRLQSVAGEALRHVKLHGALYNQVARDVVLAAAVADGLAQQAKGLTVFALAGSVFERCARERGLRVASEVFGDRTYQADGSLTPRNQPGALITDESAAVTQVLRMVREGKVRATDGTDIAIQADTVCLHGDGPQAVVFARRLRRALSEAGIEVRPCGGQAGTR